MIYLALANIALCIAGLAMFIDIRALEKQIKKLENVQNQDSQSKKEPY